MARAWRWNGWWWGVRRLTFASGALACMLLGASATRAGAMLSFPSVVERITGARVAVAPLRASLGGEPASLRVEFADAELFGIRGLRTNGVRVSGLRGSILLGGSCVNVSSPVGAHARAVVEAGCRLGNAWQGAVRAGAERLTLDASTPLTWRVFGVISRADVGRVAAIADLEVVEGAGAYDTSMRLAARVTAGAAQWIGTVRVDGDRFVGAGVSVVARLHSSLALLAGYDDGAGSLGGGVVVNWRRIEIASGVFQHPVLGVSQGVSVAWGR